jgi:uncharacterized phage protein (TIGR01671 family)
MYQYGEILRESRSFNNNLKKKRAMDRLIEFRGLNKKTNKWVYGDLIHTPERTKRIIWFELKGEIPLDVDYNSFNEVVKKESVGQFTGLIDSKGNKIFEGDLVRIETEDGEYILNQGENEVKLIDGNWNPYIGLGEYWYTLGQLKDQDVRVEVIGNIHEK